MHIPVSDADFFERKAIRLQKDVANLNEELNVARARLRSAEDFQIKYQLLLRQSQQQNLRIRKIQQVERAQIAQMIAQQIQKTNQQWALRLTQAQQDIISQEKQEKERLQEQVADLQKKIKQMNDKCEQMDVLLFKNKKIAKDLQALEQIIQQNRVNNERQRQEDLKQCKQNLTKKFLEKIQIQKQSYETIISKLKQKNEKQEIQIMKLEMNSKQKPQSSALSSIPNFPINTNTKQQIQRLKLLLSEKDKLISQLLTGKIQQQEEHQRQIKQLKTYHRQLEQQIFSLQTNHEVQILNFKIRMDEARNQQLKQKQIQCELLEKQNLKSIQIYNQKILKEKAQLEHIRKIQQAEIVKLKQDKERLGKKINQLKQRLKQYETNEQVGETQNMINSLKNMDKKQEQQSSYEEGVTFLQRQLRKAVIKLEKKNAQVKQLVTKLSNLNQQFEREMQAAREKYVTDMKVKEQKIQELEQDIKQLNQLLRKKEKDNRDLQAQFAKKMNQINAENRSLINMNNDLQRDYNRVLQSKKVIQKSFREERERSVTSKSQIAIAKKNKWLQLQRQKNQIQIIYKQKEQQMKTNFELTIAQLKTQNDKLKRDKDLIQHELKNLKQKIKNNQPIEDQKQNAYSEFNKKLATVNLEIALTENLYNCLLKAKSKVKKTTENERHPEAEIQPEVNKKVEGQKQKQKDPKNSKVAEFQANLNKVEEKGYKSFERSIKQIEKISENESREVKDSKQFDKSQNEHPLYFDSDEEGGVSPTFQMFQSFNPHR